MNNLSNHLNELISYANTLGYVVSFTTYVSISVNHTKKIIFIPPRHTLENIYLLSHEIGHCIDYKKNGFNKIKSKNKWYKIFKEFVAWYYGFRICIIFKIPLKQFFKVSYSSWKTYFKNVNKT